MDIKTCTGCGCPLEKIEELECECSTCKDVKLNRAVFGHDKPVELEEVEE